MSRRDSSRPVARSKAGFLSDGRLLGVPRICGHTGSAKGSDAKGKEQTGKVVASGVHDGSPSPERAARARSMQRSYPSSKEATSTLYSVSSSSVFF